MPTDVHAALTALLTALTGLVAAYTIKLLGG